MFISRWGEQAQRKRRKKFSQRRKWNARPLVHVHNLNKRLCISRGLETKTVQSEILNHAHEVNN